MEGKLGSLHQGRLLIGGILNWSVDINLIDHTKDTATFYKLANWKVTAKDYWLFDIPHIVIVRLYSGNGYWEGKGRVVSQTKNLFDTLIHAPIEIIGEGILEGKE